MPKLDAFDIAILSELQENGRAANVDIAEAVHLSPSPCLRRIRHLEDERVIRGYRADIDRTKVGLGMTVFVEMKVGRHNQESANRFQEALADVPEVISCFMISGSADFLAEVVVEDLPAYERVLTDKLLTLPFVTDIRSNFAIRTVKSAGPLKLPRAG